jgi:divalent metal cation (Fe/Co/Zn/Cd) transporter
MAPDMTLKESHDIATNVKRMIFLKISNIGDIMILVSPTREHPEDLIRL